MTRSGISLFLLAPALCSLGSARAAAAEAEADSGIVVRGQRDAEPVAATRTGTPLINTPQSVAVVSREQIEDQGMVQLGDALRYVPGVSLGQGEGHRDQIIVRGQSSTADFFLDGLRDDAQYYRPLYNTDRVEVLKGANALLFGRGGGGGVINRVSKQPLLGETALTASGSVDAFGAWSLAGDANAPIGSAAALRLNATHESLDNHRDFFTGHFTGFAPTIAAQIGERTRLNLAYEYAEDRRITDRGVPSLAGAPLRGYDRTFFGDPAVNRSSVTAHIARARIDHELTDSLSLNATALWANYDKAYANIVPGAVNVAANTVVLTGYNSTTDRTNRVGQVNLVWKGVTGPVRHTLLVGIEASDQDTDAGRGDTSFGGASSTTATLDRTITVPAFTFKAPSVTRSDVRTRSILIQDQLELGEHLQLLLGARYEDFKITAVSVTNPAVTSRTDRKWSPRAALIVKPRPEISLYASYAKSFLPQTGEQFTTLAANLQTLAPEEFRNLELGFKWHVADTLTINGALFRVDRFNTRAADPANANAFVLTGSTRVEGWELSLAGQVARGWHVSAGYSHQRGEIRSTTASAPSGRQLDKMPRHQASLWTRYDLPPALGLGRTGIGLGVVHQSSQFASISNAVTLPAFTRVDAALYLDLSARIALQLNVENLLNTTYYPSAHTDNNIAPGQPRNARITLRLKF